MNFGAAVALGFALFFQSIALLLYLETYMLAAGVQPITHYVRSAVLAFPGAAIMAALFVAAGVGALFAHFVWDAGKDATGNSTSKGA